jgi:hypothetical protein
LIEAGVLPAAHSRRAGDAAPTLRLVVDALIDGQPVKWEAVSAVVGTPFERRMTQQVRAIARLSAQAGACGGEAVGRVARPQVLESTLSVLALVQVWLAVAASVWSAGGVSSEPLRFGGLVFTSAAALGLMRHGRRLAPARLLGHLLLLLAAWQARPFLDAFAAAGAPLWLRAWWQALFVEAFVPVALWRLAREYPAATRLSRFDRLSTVLLGAALASSVGVAVVCAVSALGGPVSQAMTDRLVPAMVLAFGLVSLVTVATRNRPTPARPAARRGVRTPARWSPALAERVGALVDAFRGTHAAALAALGADLQHARSQREVAAALVSHVNATLHPSALALVTPDGGEWTVRAGHVPPLAAGSAIACMLASADEATRVDAGASVYDLLPAADREWLASSRVATFVRLASRDGSTLAGLLVGAHADGRRHSARERAFIAAASRAAAMALVSIGRPAVTDAHDETVDDLSFECEACGLVSDVPETCACGGARRLAALPASLHGTFRVERRIGSGGMGVVYLGVDLRLDRQVALKTLPSLSSTSVASLRSEARAMAAVSHPSFAVLYGLDDWRGTPILVTEYLAGGTLATRLAAGPLPVADALTLGATMADAVALLHERGWLHRDIKPSNIGFCGDGTPKLLDFGLTRWRSASTDAAESLAGTPLYLSPELLDGEPAGERDDVWALALVVAEMIGGTHPFDVADVGAALRCVRCRAPMQWTPLMPPAVAQVLGRALHPTPSCRLATARDFAAALRSVPAAP